MENHSSSLTNNPPGWHLDSMQKNQERWWDGSNWTESTAELPSSVHNLAEVFVVREPRARNAFISILFILFASGWVLGLREGEDIFEGILVTLFFGVWGVWMGGRTLRPGTLIADRDGFTENVWLRKPRKFRWADVAVFKISTIKTQNILFVEIRQPDQSQHRSTEGGLPQILSSEALGHKITELPLKAVYSMPVKELARKLNTMLRVHHRS